MQTIHPDLIRVSLERTEGIEFEQFILEIMSSIFETTFQPLGGIADGGADGLLTQGLFANIERPHTFVQVSVQESHRRKIRDTIHRLQSVGRQCRKLIYVTSKSINKIDLEEEELSQDTNVHIRIWDRQQLIARINDNNRTRESWHRRLSHRTSFLKELGRSTFLQRSEHVREPHVYTFLMTESSHEEESRSFGDGVLDSLILLALEGTDPSMGIGMSIDGIKSSIIERFPAATSLVESRIENRLDRLITRPRRVRHHSGIGYILPYEERQQLQEQSATDQALIDTVHSQFKSAFLLLPLPSELGDSAGILASIACRVLQIAFEKDGLQFAHSLQGDNADEQTPFISDVIADAISESEIASRLRTIAGDAVYRILSKMLSSSTPEQRKYLRQLCRAYSILFALNGEPRVLKYFDEVLSDKVLYVGTDVIVTALSERFIPEENQYTRSLLRLACESGAKLILAEPVLEEVLEHLRFTDREYRNYIEPALPIDKWDIMNLTHRILVRAYLYAQHNNIEPANWEKYIDQFCDYKKLRTPQAKSDLKHYLTSQFSLKFAERAKTVNATEQHELMSLIEEITEIKQGSKLKAERDVEMFHLVIEHRQQSGDISNPSEYGYQTWWLTAGEGAATRAMATATGNDHRVLMRPSFLSRFIQLSPSTAHARKALADYMPSLDGIRMGRRMSPEAYKNLMSILSEAKNLDPGRRDAKIASLTNQIIGKRQEEFDPNNDRNTEYFEIDFAS